MSDATPIVLSAGQKQVYDAIWRLTDRGRHGWVGILQIEGLPGSTMRAAVEMLARVGAVSVENVPGARARRYLVKAFPHRIAEGNIKDVCASRWRFKEPWYDARPIRDTGAFLAEALRVGLPQFEDANLPATLSRYIQAPPRPDARAL